MQCSCFSRDGRNCIEIVPIFSNLTKEEMLEVASITIDRTYDKGEMIYLAGDKVDKLFVIHKGKVKIVRFSQNGKEQVIRVLGPGEFMGELALFHSAPMTDNAEALEKTTMCIIDGNKLKELMGRYPGISLKIVEELSKRLDKVEGLIEDISLNTVEKRLANALINMANDSNEVVLKMSKRDLASYMGMSQETLSRKLSQFQDQGLIKLVGHRRIIIKDIEGLEEIE